MPDRLVVTFGEFVLAMLEKDYKFRERAMEYALIIMRLTGNGNR
jgi:hypothetical protein